jgi:hypothetical protein
MLALALNESLRCLSHLDQHSTPYRSATAAISARPERPQLDQRLLDAARPRARTRMCLGIQKEPLDENPRESAAGDARDAPPPLSAVQARADAACKFHHGDRCHFRAHGLCS